MKEKRTALVTESGNNLGHRYAMILADTGYEVILVTHKMGQQKFDINKSKIISVHSVIADLTNQNSIINLKDYIVKKFETLDVLINNAEIANGFGQNIEHLNINEAKYLFEINFFSILRIIKELHPLLLKSNKASIINITSDLGDLNKMSDQEFSYFDYKMIAYSTAKSALEMLTFLLAKEFKTTSISVASFDPVRLKNCTHNDVTLCEDVQQDFLATVNAELH